MHYASPAPRPGKAHRSCRSTATRPSAGWPSYPRPHPASLPAFCSGRSLGSAACATLSALPRVLLAPNRTPPRSSTTIACYALEKPRPLRRSREPTGKAPCLCITPCHPVRVCRLPRAFHFRSKVRRELITGLSAGSSPDQALSLPPGTDAYESLHVNDSKIVCWPYPIQVSAEEMPSRYQRQRAWAYDGCPAERSTSHPPR